MACTVVSLSRLGEHPRLCHTREQPGKESSTVSLEKNSAENPAAEVQAGPLPL